MLYQSPATPLPDDDLLARRDAAEALLLGRINYERADEMPYRGNGLKLARMRELLERWGNPHLKLPAVHVAGTKGKGSVSTTIASVLHSAGYRTGLFTSPHLDMVEQRMTIGGVPCPAETYVQLVEEIWPHLMEMDALAEKYGGGGPTYFEITTALAMQHFVRSQVEVAVLEVGLGGRLDSTNLCLPIVSVITSISFDHMKQLGNTLREIAGEKAGIIKPGVTVVSGVTPDEPASVIRARAAELGCQLVELGTDFDFTYRPPQDAASPGARGELDYHPRSGLAGTPRKNVVLNLLGEHQGRNAAVALAALAQMERAGWRMGPGAVEEGIRETRLPARVEVVRQQPTLIIDAAHNVASVRALVETLTTCFPAGPRILLFATTRDKDAKGMLAELLPHFDAVALTRYESNPRNFPPSELDALAETLTEGGLTAKPRRVFQLPSEAWNWAQAQASAKHLICATGSFFFAAEMRRMLRD